MKVMSTKRRGQKTALTQRPWKELLDQTPRKGKEVGVGEVRGFLQITQKW